MQTLYGIEFIYKYSLPCDILLIICPLKHKSDSIIRRLIMKTDKLYYKDSFIYEFNACVEKCEAVEGKEKRYRIVLDKTAFFPEAGGQECDTGVICAKSPTGTEAKARVLHVSEDKDMVITHLCDTPLEQGSIVKGTLNFEKRFSNMQHHSGEHIMSGLIKSLFDKDNVGFHLSGGSAVFDIAGTFTDEELAILERKANKVVTDDLEIVSRIVTANELKVIPCRSKFYESDDGASSASEVTDDNSGTLSLPTERSSRNLILLPEEIRIVSIGDVDSCACCAPHVKTTGQIGLIKIMSAEHFRGGTRFTIVCGSAALETMCRLRGDELKIMHLLSAKQGETPEAVKRLSDTLTEARQSIHSKDGQIAMMLMQHARTTGSRILFCTEIDINSARKCVNELIADETNPDRNCNGDNAKTHENAVFFFIGTDEAGYRFIIGGGKDARETLAQLKKRIDIKGGGSNLMVSGTTGASRNDIEAAIGSIQPESHDSTPSKEHSECSAMINPHEHTNNVRIILASASPRRRELLSKLGVQFEVTVSDTDENIDCKEPCSFVKELALLKARDVFKKLILPSAESPSSDTAHHTTSDPLLIVIGADTVVDLNGKVLGKPKDKRDAEMMLRGLSGNAHLVHTGIAVIVRDTSGNITEFSDCETSTVHVEDLTDKEIESYIATGEPFDKAGSYAIQGVFAPYISSIEGDYYNIVGLPLNKLYRILKKQIIN